MESYAQWRASDYDVIFRELRFLDSQPINYPNSIENQV